MKVTCVLPWTTQPLQAAASLQFQDAALGFEQNDAHGPTTILSAAADYFNTFPVFTGLAFQGPAMAGIRRSCRRCSSPLIDATVGASAVLAILRASLPSD
jgi:hypothetical protein